MTIHLRFAPHLDKIIRMKRILIFIVSLQISCSIHSQKYDCETIILNDSLTSAFNLSAKGSYKQARDVILRSLTISENCDKDTLRMIFYNRSEERR